MDETTELHGEKVEGRVRVLRATIYKDHVIKIRMIGSDYFEYILEFGGDIYSSYVIISPREGEVELSESEISAAAGLIYAGAESTINELLGIKASDETKKVVEIFESGRDKVEGT